MLRAQATRSMDPGLREESESGRPERKRPRMLVSVKSESRPGQAATGLIQEVLKDMAVDGTEQ